MVDEILEKRIAKLNDIDGIPPVMDVSNSKRTYSVEDIQRILDISRSTAYLLIKKNLFKSVKVGKQIRVSKSSFDAWLDAT